MMELPDYKSAGQQFIGKFRLNQKMDMIRVIDENRKRILLGADYRKNSQYCSSCDMQGMDEFAVFECTNLPPDKNGPIIMILCMNCEKKLLSCVWKNS